MSNTINNSSEITYAPLSPEHQANPYAFYTQAGKFHSVFYSSALNIWFVTRCDDVNAVLKDPLRFSSANSFSVDLSLGSEVEAALRQGYPNTPCPGLVDNDPPGHTRVRNLVSSILTPGNITALEPKIDTIANDLIDDWVKRGEIDIISAFSTPLPLFVMGDFLGLPRQAIQMLKQWWDDWLLMLSGLVPVEQNVECARNLVAFQHYVAGILEERSRKPQDDLITRLLNATAPEEEKLSSAEIITLVMQLLLAGHETTVNLIGNAVALLLQHPDQLKALKQNPSLGLSAVEEVLRFETPTIGLIRTTTEPVILSGVQIPAGARLQVLYASANRDESQFSEPDKFDIRRTSRAKHLMFGSGIHYCIGAALARMEGKVALEVLLQRLPNLQLAPNQEISYVPSLLMRGFTRLLVQWNA